MKQNDTITIRYPLYKRDPRTKIKKRSFIMNCENCSIFLGGYHIDCTKRGCKFQRQYDSINPELSDYTKLRLMHIYMNGFYKLSK